MIYNGDEPQDSKSSLAKSQQQNSSRPPPQQAPPSYDNHRAIPQAQPLYPQVSVGNAYIAIPPESAGRRFFRAFVVATGIWFLLSLLVRTTIHLGGHRHGDGDWGSADDWIYDIPSNVSLDRCIQGDQWTPTHNRFPLSESAVDVALADNSQQAQDIYRSEASFSLPLSSDTLFLLARGQSLGGAVEVRTSSEQAHDSAKVHVVLRYNHERIVERVKACLLEREDNENGVGIFGPIYRRSPRWEYSSSFQITVTLPELQGRSAPLHIKNFETDLHNSRHEIMDLSRKVLFDSISLKGSNGRIEVKSLKTNDGIFKTSNGAISGVFNTTDKLSLLTSNAAIRVDVNLKSEKDSIPELVARTSNGPIDANIHLSSTSGQGGFFDVSTRTSNNYLDLKFPASPLGSKLDLEASTSNGRATVNLNPAYEGSFDLRTSSTSSITVNEDPTVEDPWGKERMRLVVVKQRRKGLLAGDISWERTSQGHINGKVSVRTSNAPVLVEL